MRTTLVRILVASMLFVSGSLVLPRSSPSAAAQAPDEVRDLTDGTLLASRRAGTVQSSGSRRRRLYRTRKGAAPKPTQPLESELGLTLWKFRKSESGDEVRPLVAVSTAGKETIERWTPVRAQADTPLHVGQIVRFTVEAPRQGYLYVIGRDRGPKGYIENPIVLFPQRETDDNVVGPGKPMSIPAWSDTSQVYYTLLKYPEETDIDVLVFVLPAKLPAFVLQELKESLKIEKVVLPIPAAEIERLGKLGLTPATEVYVLDNAQVDRMVKAWSAPVEWLDAQEGEGAALTRRELTASLDPKSPLTRDDDGPQTVVRIATTPPAPWVVVMPLAITD